MDSQRIEARSCQACKNADFGDYVTFYMSNSKVPEDKPLKDSPGMKNGVSWLG